MVNTVRMIGSQRERERERERRERERERERRVGIELVRCPRERTVGC
jgi:hypothetical protein